MMEVYLYNNGGLGDQVLARILYRKILEAGPFPLQVGICKNDRELFEDLQSLGLRLCVSDYPRMEEGSPVDLAYLAPPGSLSLSVQLWDYEDTHAFQYEFLLEVFRRRMEEQGIDFDLPYEEEAIPMLDLEAVPVAPRVQALCAGGQPRVYLELRRSRDWRCRFFFDLVRMAELFPEVSFFCTLPPRVAAPNLVDVSDLGPVQLSKLSDRCDLLLGSTFDPFLLTLTEANRFKPKALCGYDARSVPRFYEYPANPTEYIGNMDELVDFLQSVFPAPGLEKEEVL
jgi:hypothetical protein